MEAYSEEQYLNMLVQLLPQGAAWPREEAADRDTLLGLAAFSQHNVEVAAVEMILEGNPARTVKMLAEWEKEFGLPDECSLSYETLAERRAALVAKYTAVGGNSLAYLVELATNYSGQVCTGNKYGAFRAGESVAGDALTNDPWRYWYRISVPETVVRPFVAGSGCAGEPLRIWGNERLECMIKQFGPAEGHALITYGGDDAEN